MYTARFSFWPKVLLRSWSCITNSSRPAPQPVTIGSIKMYNYTTDSVESTCSSLAKGWWKKLDLARKFPSEVTFLKVSPKESPPLVSSRLRSSKHVMIIDQEAQHIITHKATPKMPSTMIAIIPPPLSLAMPKPASVPALPADCPFSLRTLFVWVREQIRSNKAFMWYILMFQLRVPWRRDVLGK